MSTLKYFKIWKQHIDVSNHIKDARKYLNKDKTNASYQEIMTNFQKETTTIITIMKLLRKINNLMDMTDNKIIKPYEDKSNIMSRVSICLISAFIIKQYPKETNCQDEEILNEANKVIESYTNIIEHNHINPLKDYVHLVECLNRFCPMYSKWEEQEKEKEIMQISQTFWISVAELKNNINMIETTISDLKALKEKGETKYEGRNIDELISNMELNSSNWKNQFDNGFQELKEKVIQQVKILNGDAGVRYFESHVPLFIDPSFSDTISNIIHKAFWDSVSSDLNEKKFDKILTLLQELKYYMAICVPNRHDIHMEIDGTIDVKLWKQILENDAYMLSDITSVIDYVYSKLLDWSPAVEKGDIETEKQELLTQLNNTNESNFTMGSFVSEFLRQVFIRFETIIAKSKQYKSTDEYMTIRNNLKSK